MIFSSGEAWTKQQKIILLAIVATSLLMMVLRLNEAPLGANTDDAYYVEMAHSIAEGLGPVLNTGPGTVAENPDIFPPGFPLLLSPLAKLFPESLLVLKLVPLFFTLLFIPVIMFFPVSSASIQARLMVLALVMLNPWVIAWSGRVLSDNAYAASSLLTLLVFWRFIKNDRFDFRKLLLLALLSVLSVSLRTVGWSVISVIFLILLRVKSFRMALGYISLVLVGVLPVWFFQSGDISPITSAYWIQMFGHESGALGPLVWHNFVHYLAELPVLLIPVFGSPAESVFVRLGLGGAYFSVAVLSGVGLIGLIIIGMLECWKSFDKIAVKIFGLYLVIYAAVLMFFDGYPSGVQTRLLLPVLPVFALFLVFAKQHSRGRILKILTSLVLGMMIVSSLAHNGWRIANPLHSSVDALGNGFVDPAVGANWIKMHTPVDAVIMVQEPLHRHIHFYRDVVGFPEIMDENHLIAMIAEYEIDWIFIGPSVHGKPSQLDDRGAGILELLRTLDDEFQLEYCNSEESIFIFVRTRLRNNEDTSRKASGNE